MALQPIRDLLQQQVTRVTAEGIVDARKLLDVEHRHRGCPAPADACLERPHQALTEQPALGEPGERIEVGQETDFVFLVEVLQGKRQVRDQLAQHARLFVTHGADVVRGEHQRAHRRAIDQQWIGHHAPETGIHEHGPRSQPHVELLKIVADHRGAGAQHAADDARVFTGRLGNAERELLRDLGVDTAGPRGRARGAGSGLDESHHGTRVSTHGGCEAARLHQELAPLADPHHGAVDATQHLQYARQPADVLFLPAAFGEIALGAAKPCDLTTLAQQTRACSARASDSCRCDGASEPEDCWLCADSDPACASQSRVPPDPPGGRTAPHSCQRFPRAHIRECCAPNRCRR